jgi:putative ABC transport system ATP-binding protein
MEDAVRAVDLSKTYGVGTAAVKALDHVSLTLARGTVAALLGTERLGQVHAHQGPGLRLPGRHRRGVLRGPPRREGRRPLADLAALRRRHLGFVFQKANLTSFLTARENVEIACEFGGKTTAGGALASCSSTSRWRAGSARTPRCSAAASSSAWPSPGPWPTSPR